MTLEHLLWAWVALALLLLPLQLVIVAPYGRHVSSRWGPLLDATTAWVVMETVALVAFWVGVLWNGSAVALWPALLFSVHYVHRAFVYPFRARAPGRQMPLLIMLFAVVFNTVNGGANGWYVGLGMVGSEGSWQLVSGSFLFFAGMAMNIAADNHLIALRRSGSGYRIPEGGLFKRISCPNHAGEMLQWGGFALVCWNLPALAFWVWTVANLLPRSIAHHRWYQETFSDYPRERRALIPYVL